MVISYKMRNGKTTLKLFFGLIFLPSPVLFISSSQLSMMPRPPHQHFVFRRHHSNMALPTPYLHQPHKLYHDNKLCECG